MGKTKKGTPTRRDVLVGRTAELDELRGAIAHAVAGRGSCWLLTGDPGIGKTRLATEAAGLAEGRGATVLWGRAGKDSGAPAYWPVIQVLRELVGGLDPDELQQDSGRGIPYLLHLVPEIADSLPDAPAPVVTSDPDAARFALLDSVAVLLRNVARRRPLVLVFDDLHWADPATLAFLEFLGGTLQHVPILVVGCYRELEASLDPQLGQRLGELARFGGHVPLRGLSADEVGRITHEGFGLAVPDEVLQLIHSATGGNPFFVNEVVRLLIVDGKLEDVGEHRIELSEGIRAVIRRRLEPLPADTRELLSVAAVVGRRFTTWILAGASQRDEDDVADRLSSAIDLRAIDLDPGAAAYIFTHDLIRETLYQELSADERSHIHLRVGETLERYTGEDADAFLPEIAHHLLAALPAGDPARAVMYAGSAGDRASDRFAYEDAARHYEDGLRVLDPHLDWSPTCDLHISAGEARHRAGQLETAREHCRHAIQLARKAGDSERFARAALVLGRYGFVGARIMSGLIDDELIAVLEEALEMLPVKDTALRSSVLGRLATALYWRDEDPGRRDALSREASDMAERLGDGRTIAHAALHRYWATWGPDNADDRLQTATRIVHLGEELADHEIILQGRHLRIASLVEVNRPTELDREVAAQARTAERLRQPAYPLHTETLLALIRDRPADALERAAETMPVWSPTIGPQWADQWMGVQIFLNTWNLGKPHDLIPMGEHLVRQFRTVDVWKAALAWMRCESGQDTAAREAVEGLAADDFTSLRRDWNYIVHLAMVSWTCARLEDARRSAILYEVLEPFSGRCVTIADGSGWIGPVSHYLGMLAATLARFDAAAAHFEDAIETCHRFGARPWLARGEVEYAQMLLARGAVDDRLRAAERAERARAAAEDLGLTAVVQQAASVLTAVGRPTPEAEEHAVRREGEFWTIRYRNRTSRMRDSKGMRYLEHLLRHPGDEFHALQLTVLVEGGAGGQTANKEDALAEGTSAEPILDASAKDAYRRRIDYLRHEADQAETFGDAERASVYRAEFEHLTEQLAKAVGLGGRDRRAAIASERARINITRAIRRAIDAIQESDPDLGEHLATAVQTGTYFSYTPTEAKLPSWRA